MAAPDAASEVPAALAAALAPGYPGLAADSGVTAGNGVAAAIAA